MRTIVHVDLDAFFSAVEQRDRPELRGKPVVVGGDPMARGVVATASYEARRFGIHSAMPCRTARRLCPQAIFLPPRFDVYREVSDAVHAIFQSITGLVEPIALDEAFLDVSSQFLLPEQAEPVAHTLKRHIWKQTRLTASVGVASNKLVAKVASERDKPDGLTIVPSGKERAFLAHLPVRHLIGIGPRTEERLLRVGIERVSQLAEAEPGWLVARFGHLGLEWQRLAQGIDDRPVNPERELKQMSREQTFERDVAARETLLGILDGLANDLIPSLEAALPARTFTVKLRYADWTTITRRQTPGLVVTAEVLTTGARRLFEDAWDGRPLRLMGLAVSNFIVDPVGQLSLFESSEE